MSEDNKELFITADGKEFLVTRECAGWAVVPLAGASSAHRLAQHMDVVCDATKVLSPEETHRGYATGYFASRDTAIRAARRYIAGGIAEKTKLPVALVEAFFECRDAPREQSE